MLTLPEAKFEIEILKAQIKNHDKKYYLDNSPLISDAEYDKLRKKLEEIENQYPELITPDSPSQKVGVTVQSKFGKVKHRKPMLSLSNAFEIANVKDFIVKANRFLGLDEENEIEIFAEPKIDGLSISIIYEKGIYKQAVTRGDGEEGEDVTLNVATIKTLPKKLNGKFPELLEIRGEIYLSHQEFERINQEKLNANEDVFANPRNAASGSLRQLDYKITEQRNLQYFAYGWGEVSEFFWNSQSEAIEYFSEAGFVTNNNSKLCKTLSEIEEYYNNLYNLRPNLDYDIDGLVYKINDIKLQERLGFIARSPRWGIAHKFPAEQAKTIIKNITIQVGRTGSLTPVAELEPINIGGVIVKRATLHNKDEIERKDIRVGDTVTIQRAGDVIPQIVEVDFSKRPADSSAFIFPNNCPVCGSDAIAENDDAVTRCTGGMNCDAQAIEGLKHFVSRNAFDIEGLGEKQIELFWNKNLIKKPADIFTLEEKNTLRKNLPPLEGRGTTQTNLPPFKGGGKVGGYDLTQIPESLIETWTGFGKKSVENLFSSINSKKEIELNRFIYALGIRHIGEENAKLLAKNFGNIENLLEKISNETELLNIDGIGSKVAKSLIRYFIDERNIEIIKDLLKNIKVKNYEQQNISNSPISGKIIIFTGTLIKLTRGEAKDKAEKAGAKVSSSVSSKTDFVIAGEDAGSKLKKANELGIKIISEDEFLSMIKQ
jgi:DNA ligase (NAD+)